MDYGVILDADSEADFAMGCIFGSIFLGLIVWLTIAVYNWIVAHPYISILSAIGLIAVGYALHLRKRRRAAALERSRQPAGISADAKLITDSSDIVPISRWSDAMLWQAAGDVSNNMHVMAIDELMRRGLWQSSR